MKHSFPLCLDVDQHALYWEHIRGNKTAWILGAMAERFQRETGKNAHYLLAMAKAARLGKGRGIDSVETAEAAQELLSHVPPPTPEKPPAPPKPPSRVFGWYPSREEIDAGFYVVKPETFHTYNEGRTHRLEVIAGPNYPYGDGWKGEIVTWTQGDINAPFVPSPDVLAAAMAHDEARIAAILARRAAGG